MNLYQTLNQEYREFRMKKSLKEAEETPIVEGSDIETPTEEDFKQDDINILQTRLNEISNRLTEIDDALTNAAPDEVEALNSEKESLSLEVSKIEEELSSLNDSECSDSKFANSNDVDIKEDEAPEEGAPVEEDSIVNKIEALANISKEELTAELEKLSDEERDSIKNNFTAIKELACELFPEECPTESNEEIEEAGAELNLGAKVDVPDDLASAAGMALLASEDSEENKEDIKECEISNFKVVRKAPKSSAYMIEAQTKDGVKYITGKNFNEETKVLDEAEIADSKQEATNRFKSLLSNK